MTTSTAIDKKLPHARGAKLTQLHSEALSHDDVPDIAVERRRSSTDYSKPMLVKKLELNTDEVQRAFEHHYIRVDFALYVSTKAARSQGRTADAKRSENRLHGIFEAFSSEISKAIADMRKTLADRVPEENRHILYDHKRTFEVPARTGYSQRLINLTQMVDVLVATANVLELNNVLTPDNADKTVRSWIYRYREFCREINRIKGDSMRRSPSAADREEKVEEKVPQPEEPAPIHPSEGA